MEKLERLRNELLEAKRVKNYFINRNSKEDSSGSKVFQISNDNVNEASLVENNLVEAEMAFSSYLVEYRKRDKK